MSLSARETQADILVAGAAGLSTAISRNSARARRPTSPTNTGYRYFVTQTK